MEFTEKGTKIREISPLKLLGHIGYIPVFLQWLKLSNSIVPIIIS